MLDTQQDAGEPNGGRTLESSLPLLKQMLEAGKSGEKENRELDYNSLRKPPVAGPSVEDVLPWLASDAPREPDEEPGSPLNIHSRFNGGTLSFTRDYNNLPGAFQVKPPASGAWEEEDTSSETPREPGSPLNKHSRFPDALTQSEGFTCEECGRCFAQKRYLKRHLAVHGDGRCGACERGECLLKEHTCTDTYECDVCRKSFTRKSSLIRHCRVHAGEKPFRCEVCQRTFSQGSDLVRHTRIHTAEKPYECDVCGKAFARKNSLTRHVHVHSGQKPFACQICNKRFALRAHLRSHTRIYTGEKPYACEVCPKVFSHSSTMHRHRMTHDKGHLL